MTTAPAKPNKGRKLFFGLFVFPLLIAVGMAVLLCTVVFLTNEQETPESLITQIKTGSVSKRWQKAFELSNELNRQKSGVRSEGLVNEMVHILEDSVRYDAKTRSYIAVALSRFDTAPAREALIKGLQDPSEDVRLYAIFGLGTLKASEAAPAIRPFLKNNSDELRKTAAYVLGALGDRESSGDLKILLNDKVPDVQWNAALALARLGDRAGAPVLLQMLNRESLSSAHGMNDAEIEAVMINAIKGLALIGEKNEMETLANLSRSDKSLKVRQAALEAVQARA